MFTDQSCNCKVRYMKIKKQSKVESYCSVHPNLMLNFFQKWHSVEFHK